MEETKKNMFHDDPDFEKSFTDEQKQKIAERDEQLKKFYENQQKDELAKAQAEAVEKAKAKLQEEAEAKAKAESERNAFLGSVPEANKQFIQDALDSGKSIAECKERYKSLLETPKKEEAPKPDQKSDDEPKPKDGEVVDLNSLFNGTTGSKKASTNMDEMSDEDYSNVINSGKDESLIDPNSPRWAKALNVQRHKK